MVDTHETDINRSLTDEIKDKIQIVINQFF